MDIERKASVARAIAIGIPLFSGRVTAAARAQAGWCPAKPVEIIDAGSIAR